MPRTVALGAPAPEQRKRRLLAAAMAAPVLFQLALYGLEALLPAWHGSGAGRALAYAASGATAIAACMLVVRLEKARKARAPRDPQNERDPRDAPGPGRKGLQD